MRNAGTGAGAFDDPGDRGVLAGKALLPVLGDVTTLMGSATVTASDDDSTLSIALTPGGISYLSMFAGSPAVLAGELPSAIPPATPPDAASQLIFGFTDYGVPGDPMTP